MKKLLLVLTVAFVVSMVGQSAHAEGLLDKLNLDIEVSGSIDYYSNYIWRGFTLDKDAVIQPGINISAAGFTYSFWASFDAESDDELASDEIDHIFDYTREINDLISVSVGHTYYDFPETATYSRELYVGVALSRVPVLDWPIETSLTFFHDYGKEANGGGGGEYLSLDSSYSHVLFEDPEITMDFATHFGFNNEIFLTGEGFDTGVSFGFTIPLTDNLTISPTVNYSAPHGDLEDPADGAQEDRVYAGVSLAYSL